MPHTETGHVVRYVPQGAGRDFVVGDIHGAFALLVKALDEVAFNPRVDRLFCVGDTIDRGPASRAALAFLREPWVFATLGNHEAMLLEMYAGPTVDEHALAWNVARNGMAWWLDVPPEEQRAFLAAFAALPLAMEITTARGTVGVVHAEVPIGMDWPTFLARLAAGDELVTKSALWGRTRARTNDTSGVGGVGRVFAGHTPQMGGMRRLGNCVLVDSGAVFGQTGADPDGRLTLMSAVAGTALIPHPRKVGLLHLLEDVSLETPFGHYAGGAASSLTAPPASRSVRRLPLS